MDFADHLDPSSFDPSTAPSCDFYAEMAEIW